MARPRTQKTLARRIDRDYFKKQHPFRRWRRILSYTGVGVSIGAVILIALFRREDLYMNGPVATAHQLFARDCVLCHQGQAGADHVPVSPEGTRGAQSGLERAASVSVDRSWRFWRDVTDSACVPCHAAPRHHVNETFAPGCNGCHEEHKGRAILSRVDDRFCLQCHADLRTTTGRMDVVLEGGRRITSFSLDHPEFAVAVRGDRQIVRRRLDDREKVSDTTPIELNHAVHLKPALSGPEKQPVQMRCGDCHYADWSGAYMQPIQYERHCMACHLLEFDARFQPSPRRKEEALAAYRAGRFAEYVAEHPDQYPVVPHGDPSMIRTFLQDRYAEYLMQHPDVAGRGEVRIEGRLPRRPLYKQLPVTARAWVDEQVRIAETLLYRKTCRECHRVVERPGELAQIVPPQIPARWFPHSRFSHETHREVSCLACHSAARTSQTTRDILVPGIALCRSCHAPGKARADCVECHFYHSKQDREDFNGPFTIEEITRHRSPVSSGQK
ncbi:MAG TPA: hypothetical protein VNM72_00115 [Blastocatellia bacterium]|nr:hypothetical protein [Blastocatellia bacterium]